MLTAIQVKREDGESITRHFLKILNPGSVALKIKILAWREHTLSAFSFF